VTLDPRRHAFREDLAASSLKDRVEAPRYVEGEQRQVVQAVLPLRKEPRFDALLESEALLGELVTVFDESEGWAWVQLARDDHVGYMPSDGLSRIIVEPTHKIAALRTYVFPAPDPKSPPTALLSLNAAIASERSEGKFLVVDGAYVYAAHTRPSGGYAADPVEVAQGFLGAPYLWGGRTSVGLDCSGLVQLACEAAGIPCPRDTDMQAAELGSPLDLSREKLARGDLVFWDGHVGMMTSPDRLLHANAYHMAVVEEPFAKARDRISASSLEILGARRLRVRG
jgi:dipeptidyl peptidase-like protein/NlpC/P60 family protein